MQVQLGANQLPAAAAAVVEQNIRTSEPVNLRTSEPVNPSTRQTKASSFQAKRKPLNNNIVVVVPAMSLVLTGLFHNLTITKTIFFYKCILCAKMLFPHDQIVSSVEYFFSFVFLNNHNNNNITRPPSFTSSFLPFCNI